MSYSRNDIIVEARRWLGTPYHHQASLRGVGTDCLGLVRGVWRALHGAEAEPVPAYSRDWAEATGDETMLAAARRHLREIDRTTAQPGDVLIFRFRAYAVAKHVAILAGPTRMIHAVEGLAVAEVALVPWWHRHTVAAFSFPRVTF